MRKNFFLFLLAAQSIFSNSLEKGFDALKIYNYFEAKKQFTNALRHHASGAEYGLSVIFYRNDNPFFNIDSAYQYILLSEKKRIFIEAECESEINFGAKRKNHSARL